jgi:hypothetical protein
VKSHTAGGRAAGSLLVQHATAAIRWADRWVLRAGETCCVARSNAAWEAKSERSDPRLG